MLSGDECKDVEPDSDSDGEEGEEGDDAEADDGDDNGDDEASARTIRSAYVGRGNVQAVREARKRAGLSDSFRNDDPLIKEFAAFLRASGAAANDVMNKTHQVSKLLRFLSTRYSLQCKVK